MCVQGLEQTGERFIVADSDTIIDGAKRLVWLKKDTWQMAGKWMAQRQVIEFAGSLNRKRFAGFSNWRLPTTVEAKSLFDKKQKNSDHMGKVIYLSDLFDPGCGLTCWTKTLNKSDKGLVIRFHFYNGDYKWHTIGLRSHGVRAVRNP